MLRAFVLMAFMVLLNPTYAGFLTDPHPCKRDCRYGGPKTCEYEFIVEDHQTMSEQCGRCPLVKSDCDRYGCIPADGWKRDVTVINRQLPSPDIQVCLNDKVKVTVINKLAESTSIHWHGQHQKKTPDMDGVPMVTQCPIEDGTKFVYDFEALQPGTMFYHSHTGFQKEDGMYAPFIIREANDLQKGLYDQDRYEHVMIVNDWTHIRTAAHNSGTLRKIRDNPPLGMLINGRGANRTYSDNTGVQFETPMAEFYVTEGTRYRFRVVGSGVFPCPIQVSIDDHDLNIIAVDGMPVKATRVTFFVINTGERYDFVPQYNSYGRPSGSYWIKVRGLMNCARNGNTAYQYAVLRYNGDTRTPVQQRSYNNADPSTRPYAISLNEPLYDDDDFRTRRPRKLIVADLEAISNNYDPSLRTDLPVNRIYIYTGHKRVLEHVNERYYPLKTLRLRKAGENEDSMWTIPFNNISFRYPTYPLLTQSNYYDPTYFCNDNKYGWTDCSGKYCECPHVIKIPLNTMVELVITDLGVPFASSHPIHIHGYTPRVVATERLGPMTTVEEVKNVINYKRYKENLRNPPYKDTLTTPDGGFIIYRFFADNPGFWLMHCHISVHLHIGMAVVFQVGEYSDMVPITTATTCGHPEPLTETTYYLG